MDSPESIAPIPGRAMPSPELPALHGYVTLDTRTFARLFVAYLALGGDPAEMGPQLAALAARHRR